jgi:ribosomal protein S12 methylthiotransferase
MKVYLLSLGCPKNLVDSEHAIRKLTGGGALPVDTPEEADVLIVNTCGFIEEAKKESIEEILKLAKMKDNKKLLVMGCLSQRYGAELEKELPEVDAFWGVDAGEEIAKYLGLNGDPPIPPLAKGGTPGGVRRGKGELPSTFPYAYLKIAEGCKRRCTFCSIPAIRGPHRSFPPDEILEEARAYVAGGIKELILVSQDTASYNYKGYDLPKLLRDICSISGNFRVRVHYLYPQAISEALLDIIRVEEKIVKYLDIPLQHSEERILRAMGRGGGAMGRGGAAKDLIKFLTRVRRAIPGAALRSSFIVGFPGETEEEFRRLLDFIHEAAFESMGAFMYSKEEGTGAAALKGHLPQSIKKRRYDELMRIQARISLEKNMALVGQEMKVLIDSSDGPPGKMTAIGRTDAQSPDIDGVVFVESDALTPGDFARVRIKEAYDYDLLGEAL